mgnify:FL=1
MNKIKEIPYSVSDLREIVRSNMYYVDKTMYIPLLEDQPRNLFFIRPRRFGKSLLLSMMCAYYDINLADRFEELFGNLWIGSHPTPNRGKFQILFFDFSRIGGDIEHLSENFNNYCNICIDNFIQKYSKYYNPKFVDRVLGFTRSVDKLNAINLEAKDHEYALYLIIDEYDNFTNVVLNEHGEKVYWALTHAQGFYREIFKVFKGAFTRIFMTGVSPVTLDDLTSGFNVGWHISTNPNFNQMLGFSTEEVYEMFEYFKNVGKIRSDCDVKAVIDEMKPWYDNYCFSEDALRTQSKVFNCDMVLYFLRNYAEKGEAPKQMLDPNTKPDYNKMKKLLQLDKLDGNRKGIIYEIAEKGEIISTLETTFPAESLTNPNMFVSLLFYYGMLTIKGVRGGLLTLGIPNNNVRKQYYGYLLEQYEEKATLNSNELQAHYCDMAYEGKWREALHFLADSYAKVSSVRDGIEAERNIQGFFMAYLSLSPYYYTAPELELSHGYCDFFLLPDLTHYKSKHSYILELKLIPKKEKGMSDEAYEAAIEKQWEDAKAQIKRYAEAPRVEALRQDTQLHKIIMQFDDWKLKRMDEV